MSPQKRASKKVAKTKKAQKAPAKKLTLSKKSVAKKKVVAKKPAARVGKKESVHKAGRGAARATSVKGDRRKAKLHVGALGEWTEDSSEEQDREPTLFEDEIPPDYGGSK